MVWPWLVCGFLLCVLLGPAVGQVPYGPPQDYTAIALNDSSIVEPEYACRNGPVGPSGYVLQRFYSLQLQTLASVIGCCPLGSFGVVNADENGIIGCCPEDTIPCVNDGVLIACTTDPSLCCGSARCSTGYGCCPTDVTLSNTETSQLYTITQCCPTNGNNATDFGSYCYTISNYSTLTPTVYAGCNSSLWNITTYPCYSYSVGYYYNDSGIYSVNSTNNETNVYCTNLAECTFDAQSYSFNYSSSNTTEVDFGINYIAVGCCAAGTVPCINGGSLVGCADPSQNETCCGASICPLSSSCLLAFDASTNTTSAGCCPAGLQGCVSPASPGYPSYFFCGAPYNGTDCVINQMQETGLFAEIGS